MRDDYRWEGATLHEHPDSHGSPTEQEREPYFLLWLVYLFFRPRTFFSHFINDKWPSLLVVCAWIFGMARAADRLITRGAIQGTQNNPVLASWTIFWPSVLIGGAISGLLYFYIGGWWFRLRIRWSGDPDPDKTLARRVYLYAAQILAVPSLMVVATTAPMYASPVEMIDAPMKWWDFLTFIFAPWAIIASFIGVRTVFDTSRIRALIWFVILPMVLIVGAVALVIIGMLMIASAPNPPEITAPLQHHASKLVFNYPSNWTIDTQDPDHDPDLHITINTPQDVYIRVAVYSHDVGVKAVLDASIDAYRGVIQSLTKSRDLTTWHGMYGLGEQHTGTIEGRQYTLTVFERPVADGIAVEIVTIHLVDDTDLLRPGFEIIARSLNFTQ